MTVQGDKCQVSVQKFLFLVVHEVSIVIIERPIHSSLVSSV